MDYSTTRRRLLHLGCLSVVGLGGCANLNGRGQTTVTVINGTKQRHHLNLVLTSDDGDVIFSQNLTISGISTNNKNVVTKTTAALPDGLLKTKYQLNARLDGQYKVTQEVLINCKDTKENREISLLIQSPEKFTISNTKCE